MKKGEVALWITVTLSVLGAIVAFCIVGATATTSADKLKTEVYSKCLDNEMQIIDWNCVR